MASFKVEKRKTAAGVIRYRCIVRVKKDKAVVYQESRTYGKLADARTKGDVLSLLADSRDISKLQTDKLTTMHYQCRDRNAAGSRPATNLIDCAKACLSAWATGAVKSR